MMKEIYHIIHFFVFAIAGIILSKGTHQNHSNQANQKDDHHKTIENAEPMNLKIQFQIDK
jgi:hypothetical protein